MSHPLESAITDAIKREKDLQRKLTELEGELKAALERENILKGRIEVLDESILDWKAKSDHWMTCTVEIARQTHNIGMFVDEAMRLAKAAVRGGNSGDMKTALDAVEQMLIGVQKVEAAK
jgi:chromosome segregation ATPase